jgi:two-component system sensor histidine kinase HydH
MSPQAAGQGVRLKLLSAAGALPRIDVDPEKIEQAVLNLVLNALEAMPDGGDLTVGAEFEAGKLRMVVGDSGRGIPAEIQDHILHPYFSTKGTGTGMGLALAEKLVRQHQGQLEFKTGSAGTTFSIVLPCNGRNGSDLRS